MSYGGRFLIGSIWEQIFVDHIFPLLTTHDLCSVSVANKFFSFSTMSANLWIDLASRNFLFPHEISNGVVDMSLYDHDFADSSTSQYQSEKEIYAFRLRQRLKRYARAKAAATARALLMDKASRRESTRGYVYFFLDVALLHLVAPLSLLLLFLSVLFFAQHSDGSDMPLWACVIPPVLYFLHLLALSVLAFVVQAKVFVTGSILYGMWLNIEPPFKSFYPIHKFENWFRNFIQVYFYSMCAVQSALFVLKIYSRTFKPVNWAIIFSPAYYTLGAYPCFPAGPLKDYIWCMLLTLLALITIKLSPNESTVGGSVNWLVVVIIPLFCVQGYTFLYNHFPYAPVEQDLRSLSNRKSILHFYCMTVLATLCQIDDNGPQESFTKTLAPILLLLGLSFCYASYQSLSRPRRLRQIPTSQLNLDSAGQEVLFPI